MNNSFLKFLLYGIGISVVEKVQHGCHSPNSNKKNMAKTIPSFNKILEVKHYLPGRVRLCMPLLKNNIEAKDLLISQLNRIQPINLVEINTVTCSILIKYEENQLKPILLMGIILKLLGLENEITKEPESLVKKELSTLKDSVNLAIYNKTNGILDIKGIMSLLLIICGINKCMKTPTMAPGGITYLWWAYSNINK